MIPLLKPSSSGLERRYVLDTLATGWWGEGPRVKEFEEKLAARYGYAHCVAVNSCTAALHLALLANGIGPGDEVIVPALTFVSTALAVGYCGARPIFADVNDTNLCINWADVCWKNNHGTKKAKAVIAVDYAGYPAALSLKGVSSFLPVVIQDAAHSCGGYAYGTVVCLSFHPVKNLATGDGGAILTNNYLKAERMRALRWCGIDRSTWQRARKQYSWDYDMVEIGYKCHWNDIQAAIGLAQLERLDAMNTRRREIAEAYTDALEYMVQCPPDSAHHTWHLYPIRVDAGIRDSLLDRLADQGISAGVHYKPLTYYPMYNYQPTPPVTEREWRRLVSLPIYADMQDWEVDKVIGAIKAFMGGEDAKRREGTLAATRAR